MTTDAAQRGIPTKYRNTQFRSRLEARWAAFFDLVSWKWVYEPFDADGWIPDFLIAGPWPFLVEVGPCLNDREYIAKGGKARSAFPVTGGDFGRHILYEARQLFGGWEAQELETGIGTAERWTLVVGVSAVLGNAESAGLWALDAVGSTTHEAWWYRCDECSLFGLASPDFGGYLRPCGHAVPIQSWPGASIFDLWADAGNKVQWRPLRRAS